MFASILLLTNPAERSNMTIQYQGLSGPQMNVRTVLFWNQGLKNQHHQQKNISLFFWLIYMLYFLYLLLIYFGSQQFHMRQVAYC